MSQNKTHTISLETPISPIFAAEEFLQLNKSEQEYTYYLHKASWEGTKICFFQKSWESPALFYILQNIFTNETLENLKKTCLKNEISEENFSQIICFCAAFIQECGNYKHFGDTKIIPNCTEEIFYKFISASKCYKNLTTRKKIDNLWNKIKRFVFNSEGIFGSLGLFPLGLSGYYAHEITKEEIKLVDEFLQVVKISALNTRIGKIFDKEYTVLIASINYRKKCCHFYKDIKIHIIYVFAFFKTY